jgi:hypothetical protein
MLGEMAIDVLVDDRALVGEVQFDLRGHGCTSNMQGNALLHFLSLNFVTRWGNPAGLRTKQGLFV